MGNVELTKSSYNGIRIWGTKFLTICQANTPAQPLPPWDVCDGRCNGTLRPIWKIEYAFNHICKTSAYLSNKRLCLNYAGWQISFHDNLYIGWCIYMGMQVYQNTNFKVYKSMDGYIVHNTIKGFQDGHTHVQKYATCMVLIKLLTNKKIPKSKSRYFLESLLRLCDDENYKQQLLKMLLSIQ